MSQVALTNWSHSSPELVVEAGLTELDTVVVVGAGVLKS